MPGKRETSSALMGMQLDGEAANLDGAVELGLPSLREGLGMYGFICISGAWTRPLADGCAFANNFRAACRPSGGPPCCFLARREVAISAGGGGSPLGVLK